MKKNIVQDVVPPKKTIRSVELPSRRGAQQSAPEVDEYTRPVAMRAERAKPTPIPPEDVIRVVSPQSSQSTMPPVHNLSDYNTDYKPSEYKPAGDSGLPPLPPETPSYSYDYEEPHQKSRKLLYSAIFVFVVALAFGISAFFKSAEIKVTPRHETHAISSTFTAQKDAAVSGLGFQLVSVSGDTDTTVPAGASQKVTKKARGTIVIFNDFSSASQKLVATTRFQTPEGLVFRIVNAVTIPGTQVKAGKTIPGSVEATVEADKAGPEYNVGLKDFTVPGLKGDARYTHIYGRSKTTMSGGFDGIEKAVSAETLKAADATMEAALKTKLANDIVTQIPANFILYPAGISYSFTGAEQVATSDGDGTNANLRKKGTVTAVIFDKASLTRAIIAKVLPEVTDDMLKITNLENLTFTFGNTSSTTIATTTSSTTASPSINANTLSFSLAGDAEVVWTFDENQLKTELLGLTKEKAKAAIATHPAILEAWIQTKPFWNSTIPTDPLKVTLINTLTLEGK